MITRNDEEKYLDKSVAAFPGFNKPFTYSDAIRQIGRGKSQLSLEMIEREAVDQIDDSDIEIIEDTMRFLLNIVEKPRMFIRSVEEKVPIDQAKRINYQAIAKLSRDSNDWYSRTLVSVKPKLIHAEVTEDTLDIYENRFAVTLFDWVYRIIYAEYNIYLGKRKNAGDTLALDFISRLYTGHIPNWGFTDVCYSDSAKTDSKYILELEQHIKSLERLMRKMTIIRSSELYQTLRKKKRLTGNIQRTNILMFDPNYNRAYKLWLYLHEKHYDSLVAVEEEQIDRNVLSNEYQLYCFLNLCICLDKMGIKCTQSPTYRFNKKRGLTSDGVAKFLFFGNELELELEGDHFKLRYHIQKKVDRITSTPKKNQRIISDKDRETVDEFWFYPKYDDLEKFSQNELIEKTTDLFNELTEKNDNVCRYAMLSINLDTWGDKGLKESLCRRLFNSGDNLSDEESAEDLDHWSDFKTGIALISAYPFRTSSGLGMLTKILYNHLMKPLLKTSNMGKCPVCGGNTTTYGDGMLCSRCNIRISYTYCTKCDGEKKRPIFWIKYKDDKILQERDVMKNCETTPLFKIDTISKFMPICSLTSFDIQAENKGSKGTEYKFKTICPRCGTKLGGKS